MPGIGGFLEKDGVDDRLVLEGNRCDLGGQREHHVEIGHRQKFARTRGQPVPRHRGLALRAVPVAAGIVGHTHRSAGPAPLDMATKHGGAAQLDRAHHAPLDAAQMTVMGLPIGFAMVVEDIRHLQSRRHGTASVRRHHFDLEPVERALRAPNETAGNFGVAPCLTGCCGRAEPG